MTKNRATTHSLNAIPDPNHPSYKVIGLLAWLTLGLSVLGTLAFPRVFLIAARLFTFYLLARLLVTVIFYLVGVIRCHTWKKQEVSGACIECQASDRDNVHHVVIIPNYKEPMAVLRRTLQSLAAQENAQRCLTVVLAMEEREAGAREKARALRDLFADRFARLLVTVHPADLPGEIAGKGSNQAWAARQANRELVERLGLPIEHLTLTSCDADSVLHPRYFAKLARLFANDPGRHRRFWFAPVFYRNNIWQTPAPIRLLAFYAAAARLGELANPLFWSIPVSTYTLSFKLADDVGYWDPAVIPEDYHMYLRCFFAKHGQTSLTPIFLPTSADAVEGETLWRSLANYYRQQLRHAWGAEDVGYILQQWHRSPGTPWHRKLLCFSWILHHHLLRSTSWFIITLGSLLLGLSRGGLIAAVPGQSLYTDLTWSISALGIAGSAAMWLIERSQSLPRKENPGTAALVQEIAAWALMPVTSLLFTLPGLHAQSKLLFGSQLTYQRTPKGASLQNLAAPPGV